MMMVVKSGGHGKAVGEVDGFCPLFNGSYKRTRAD